jgi:hypothetical protein
VPVSWSAVAVELLDHGGLLLTQEERWLGSPTWPGLLGRIIGANRS